MCKAGMLIIMSRFHGEIIHVKFDGQMNMSSSTRNNIHSQVIYINSIIGFRSGSQSKDRPGAVGLECSEPTHVCEGWELGAVQLCDQNF